MARTPRRSTAGAGATGESTPRRVRENLPRPVATAPSVRAAPGAPAAPPVRKRSPFAALSNLQPRFIADIVSELRKVT